MLNDYFGEWMNGKLGRKRFAILYVVLVAAIVIFGLLLMNGMIIPIEEGGSMRRSINEASPLVAGILMIFSLAFWIALINIVGKRVRDMGLPGWLGIVLFLAGVVAAFMTIAYAFGLVITAMAIIIALVPTGKFSRDLPAA
ncbi:DUF805 domain-containing protein [Sphingomicrobium lutaoense]|uniref:Uncharacterized membrane protein YhaH (DUF805 family) n=1 Tax=Sphingomicrobium lutaoense TaxID=515949 RepID=A0A839YV38_9SPHN|nr:DUF805 domain-containing protein [Sphingomicrobium lutaoense]MBB3763079.1 uncharacterized membrane protein YhaH (DUF805 family) [Sphingomicrobium lutaoense]